MQIHSLEEQKESLKAIINKNNYNDWKIFKQSWKPICISSQEQKIEDQSQLQSFWKNKISDLLQDTQKMCYMFVQNQRIQFIERTMKMMESKNNNFKEQIDYEYHSLYLGNEKQLMIYKKDNRNFLKVLSNYRLPKNYQKLYERMKKLSEKLQKLIRLRNLAISRNNKQLIVKCSEEIKMFKKKQFNSNLQQYLNFFQEILIDFKYKQNRKEIFLKMIPSQMYQSIQMLCQKENVYIMDRYFRTDHHSIKDMLVVKQMPLMDCHQYSQEEEEQIQREQNEQQQEQKQQKQEQENQQNMLKLPENIDYCRLFQIQKNGEIKIQIGLPLDFSIIKIQIISSKSHNSIEIPVIKDKRIYQLKLPNTIEGYCQYIIRTINQNGHHLEEQNKSIKIYHQKMENSMDLQLYFLGDSGQNHCLIPFTSEDQFLNHNFSKQSVYASGFKCKDFSVGTNFILCSSVGVVVGWGRMFIHQNQVQAPPQDNQIFGFRKTKICQKIQKPCRLLNDIHHIRQVSCGEGYSLMCDVIGRCWAMGLNNSGQLGQGNTDNLSEYVEPIVIPYFKDRGIFIVSVKASTCCSSFAIDHKGQSYRWGFHQVSVTTKPVQNRFGDIINYKQDGLKYFQPQPQPISKLLLPQPISTIETGNQFFIAMSQTGKLYGWGNTKYLAIKCIDAKSDLINYIYNPIELPLKSVKKISCGSQHSIATLQNNHIMAWGNPSSFMNNKKNINEIIIDPMDITDSISKNSLICCGPTYTVFTYQKQLGLIGNSPSCLSKIHYQLQHSIRKIQCYRNMIVLLEDREATIMENNNDGKSVENINDGKQ